jgi:hypothetical protein
MEDVLVKGRDNMVNGPDLLATGGVHGHPAFEHLISDRQPLVHE